MKRITMSTLGARGRFANQIFQYAFLRVYAKQHGLTVQTPPWIGEKLFGIDSSPITGHTLPPYQERLEECGLPKGLPGLEAIDHNWFGYGQFHTSYYALYYEFLRDLFRPTQAIQRRMLPATDKLLREGAGTNSPRTVVGIHLRRGDYGRFLFYITPVEWYLEWLCCNWSSLDNPVLFVASEDRSLVDEFADYNPQTAESLGVDLQAEPLPVYKYQQYDLEHPEPHLFDFFPDWYLLTQCGYLLIPNSTFSFAAAMFSERLQRCFRSDLPTQQFVEINPWDDMPMAGDMAEDWRHVPGVCMTTNPQWTEDDNRIRIRDLD